jgi:hypothetical protein
MISDKIIGCRVYLHGDVEKKVVGKIVGSHNNSESHYKSSSSSTLNLFILKADGGFECDNYYAYRVVEEDLKKVFPTIEPEPIDNRFGILDIRAEE